MNDATKQVVQKAGIPAALIAAVGTTHPEWQPVLLRGLQRMNAAFPGYLAQLANAFYLPDQGRIFAAFSRAPASVRYILIGEGPYPRAESATGVCFMDGAVGSLWSDAGLSKPVNRATSLRNFMKMLLVADGRLSGEATGGSAIAEIARHDLITTLPQLQQRMEAQGFLLLNASLVWRPDVTPQNDAKPWRLMLETVLAAFRDRVGNGMPVLVLWGKIASAVQTLPEVADFPAQVSEHPYNLSFIHNTVMQSFFGPMQLLKQV